MMLPFKGSGTTSGVNFLDFYQGALIALEDLKREGANVRMNVFDTERSESKVIQIVNSQAFAGSDIIIGPVYEDVLAPVLEFAREEGIVVVSPLAQLENSASPQLYQLSPDPAHKYDKVKGLLSADKNVVVVSMATNDREFESEITPLLPANHKRISYSRQVSSKTFEDFLRSDRDNVLVVLGQDEAAIDEFMSRVSSIQNNLTARSMELGPITILGSSRWQRFVNLDRTLFFKLNLCYITSYHADRSDPTVLAFNKRYISAFNSLPTLYSYRGYDAVRLFVWNIIRREGSLQLQTELNLSTQKLLQMPYKFEQKQGGTHVNTQWALVCYRNSYTIEVQ